VLGDAAIFDEHCERGADLECLAQAVVARLENPLAHEVERGAPVVS
jgi:hypothetical protein